MLDYSKIINYEESKIKKDFTEQEFYFMTLYNELFHIYNMSKHNTKYHNDTPINKLKHFRESAGSTVNNKNVKRIFDKLNKKYIDTI